MRRIIAEQWNSYKTAVISPDASNAQLVGSRSAFYAGAIGLYYKLMEGLSGDPETADKATPADLQLLDDITAEFAEYRKEVAQQALLERHGTDLHN